MNDGYFKINLEDCLDGMGAVMEKGIEGSSEC